MDFSEALTRLKNGEQVSREGWNGKGQFVVILNDPLGEMFSVPVLALATVPGVYVPWVASQTDILADDWIAVQV